MLRWFWLVLSHIPLWMMYAMADIMFLPFYHIVRYRRDVVRRNLTESFPEKTATEIRGIERRFYRFFLDIFFETCKMATMPREAMLKRMKFVNAQEIGEVLRGGRSVSLCLGHYANWEWISSMPMWLPDGVIGGQVYRRLANRAVDRLMIAQRERWGAVCIERREVARRMNEWSDRVSIVGYIADQVPKMRDRHYWVDFLNHRTPAFTGAQKITERFGMEAWYLDVRRMGRGRYEARFVRLEDGEGAVTDSYYRHLEQTIRRDPEFYLWTHNRFK